MEEAERIKQLGYDREKEKAEEEAKAKKQAESLKSLGGLDATSKVGGGSVTSTRSTPVDTKPKGNAQDLERLGMGMKRLGFGGVPTAASPSSSRFVFPRSLE